MSSFRSFSEIVATMIQRLRLTQPNLDTKPGTVSRDLFIDIPADQIARLYSAINLVSEKQSLATTSGGDLDKLASNFGVVRNTGSAANGIVVFCTNSLVSDISIPTGTLVTARNGATFRTIGNFSMTPFDKNRLAANASRMRKSLNIAGISAMYALEVPVQAVRSGSAGNVSSLQMISTDLDEPVSVTNLTSTSGGANNETDDSFRSRILSVFSGANIGTSLGYRNALIGVEGVVDALIVEPGNSLMLRDGTETLELENGSSRILNSGSGGKVDAYILGRKIQEVSESYIFTDLSGSGDVFDDRNDYVLGQTNQDLTRTSEERRVLAFQNANVPAQPVDSIVSITGSSSGVLVEKYIDINGNVKGNYELIKDFNPETGGSPFGFDRITFTSNTKEVLGESLSKKKDFGIDALAFTGINTLQSVFSDINQFDENSSISSAGNKFIKLNHAPVVNVSKITNKTTGEIYTIVSQNKNSEGINEDGIIEISGRSLPSSADILSVNYTWRHEYDPYIDFAGTDAPWQFSDKNKVDSIDWSSAGGIFEEESTISRTDDGLVYEVSLENNVSRPVSLYRKDVSQSTVSVVKTVGAVSLTGIEISLDDDVIRNIISVKRTSDHLELYNTANNDGYFESRVIYLPSDSQASIDDEVVVSYNKVELFDLPGGDGSFYNNKITLPSDGTLEEAGVLEVVEEMFFSAETIYASYVAEISSVYKNTNLSNLPINSVDSSNNLVGLDDFESELSNQPIFFRYGDEGEEIEIERFGPAPLLVSTSGVVSPGKIKISGETLTRLSVEVNAGIALSNSIFSLRSELSQALGVAVTDNIGIARVDRAMLLDSDGNLDKEYNVFGCSVSNNKFSKGLSQVDDSLQAYEFRLPDTAENKAIKASSGDTILLHILAYNLDDYEELYFASSGSNISKNRFGRVSRISVSSGFRTTGGVIAGSVEIKSYSQPSVGETYFANYDFTAPKEGERITISYNVNRLVIDATSELERVRPITADVLVKEAEELTVDVQGTLLINDDALNEAERITDSVINAVTNLLNTARLGSTVDYSDVISVAAAQNGVDSVNISIFNETGKAGRRAYIQSLDNQTISPGKIFFEAVSRSKFRIN